MKRESVLTEADKTSIEIVKFIFHIIIEKEQRPIYLNQVNLDDDQNEFFKKRLIDVAQGIRYIFTDKSTSTTYDHCKTIIEDESKFINLSKKLAASFQDHHMGSTTDGVFVVSQVKIRNNPSYIFLLKIDNRMVYQYSINKDKASLKKIKDTFVEDVKAIQKMALISIGNDYIWEALAFDRNSGDSVKKYFKKFLSVTEKDDIFDLTKKALSLATKWANQNQELLNDTDNTTNYRQRAVNYLSDHTTFISDDFIEAVLFDDNDERKTRAKSSFKGILQEEGLYGQEFKISQKALSRNNIKHTKVTAEGLTMTWTGDPAGVNLTIPRERQDDGMHHIIIKTNDFISDTSN